MSNMRESSTRSLLHFLWQSFKLEAGAELLKAIRAPESIIPTLGMPVAFYALFTLVIPGSNNNAAYLLAQLHRIFARELKVNALWRWLAQCRSESVCLVILEQSQASRDVYLCH
ncbi:MAG: hypothetical protein ACI97K_000214 [Glaciecola sp.]|jgi:hypothetical protein